MNFESIRKNMVEVGGNEKDPNCKKNEELFFLLTQKKNMKKRAIKS